MGRAATRGCLLILVLLAVPTCEAAEVALSVVEDTWIQGLGGTIPQGANVQLGICPSANYWIYLKFDLAPVACPVTGAELRLVRISGVNPSEISLYEVFDDGWSEATLTGPTRPEPTAPTPGTGLASGEALAGYDRWTSPALDQVVAEQASGDGTLSLMLREDPFPMVDIRYYRSKEAAVPAEDKPRLLVELGTNSVEQLTLARDDGTLLTWQSTGVGGTFDIASGSLADLVSDMGVGGAGCLAEDVSRSSFEDPSADPAPGQGSYYFVRVQDGCGTGSWGSASDGQERTPVAACP